MTTILSYFAGTAASRSLSQGLLHLPASPTGRSVQLRTWCSTTLTDEELPRFLEAATRADVLLVSFWGSPDSLPFYQELVNAVPDTPIVLKSSGASVTVIGADMSAEARLQLARYLDYGGPRNAAGALGLLANVLDDADHALTDPVELPWEGVYHPRLGGITTLTDYVSSGFSPDRWTAGIFIHRLHLLSGETETLDALIHEIEKQGGNAFPVFLRASASPDYGTGGYEEVIAEYFLDPDGPRIDVLINLLSMPVGHREKNDSAFAALDVPVIKAAQTSLTREQWEESPQGVSPFELVSQFSYPELAGMISGPLISFRAEDAFDEATQSVVVRHEPDLERVQRLVSTAGNWARLRHTAPSEKRVVVMLHNYPPRDDTIASASGLDTPASLLNLMHRLSAEGYDVGEIPRDGAELMDLLRASATNDRRWVSPTEQEARATALVNPAQSATWLQRLPEDVQQSIVEYWGPPPGTVLATESGITVPGVRFGNIFVSIQPTRGRGEDLSASLHDPYLPLGHHYLGVYTWLREEFAADAIIHFGTHGSLEWLPGKALGLSAECQGDIALGDLPNLYPYIVNNPGEGMQAKRRSYATLIGHMSPPLAAAGMSGSLADLDEAIDDYRESHGGAHAEVLADRIWELTESTNMDGDLGLPGRPSGEEFPAFVSTLDNRLSYLKEMQITVGLHTLGVSPQGERLVEYLVALLRHPQEQCSSLREIGARALGLELDELLADPSRTWNTGTYGSALDLIHEWSREMVASVLAGQSPASTLSHLGVTDPDPSLYEEISAVVDFLRTDLLPRIEKTGAETDALVHGLEGRRIAPGPSGAASKSSPEVLPTGRNFYSVNPRAVPTRGAWQIGCCLAEDLLARHQDDTGGELPEQITMIIKGVPLMRNKGESVAEMLYLMGVRPVWNEGSGLVRGLEVIPLEELGRPRIDVTTRLSGLVRDTFPNLLELLDDAVEAVGFLDEPDEWNFIARNIRAEIEELKTAGMPARDARRAASYRLFSSQPGVYGAGPDDLVEAGAWQERADLGEIFLEWGGYAYGRSDYGIPATEQFRSRLSEADAVVRNIDTREVDLLGCSCQYGHFGGLIAAVEKLRGRRPASYVGDSTDSARVRTTTIEEEMTTLLRSKILNPTWIESMQEHGYKGAGDIAKKVDRLFGWDATASTMQDWMYDDLADAFVRDSEFSAWLDDVNPHAKFAMAERLLEANQRGMWDTTPERLADLRDSLLDVEGDIEAGSPAH